ncbi:MAG: hypothetical protein FWE22_00760 [Firmicutes bacterium]|nr:hypothetical protein [Bacillota bacterium]
MYSEKIQKHYLEVGGIKFDDSAGGCPIPSQIIPSLQLIKNTERSIGGKLHVDIVSNKQRLQVAFDILKDFQMKKVMEVFEVDNGEISPDGLDVKYFDLKEGETSDSVEANPLVQVTANSLRGKTRYFVVDSVNFNPIVAEEEIIWRDVIVNLIEV